ncbi:hypothetical protein BQ8420_00170 [Nocardiopsis sp. JB363]|nr:hypothetical protein BQ8420_00170 [Nocardiopsis sp. JB363]
MILVEGDSDEAALASLAERRGLDPTARGTVILSMGGDAPALVEALSATNIPEPLDRTLDHA